MDLGEERAGRRTAGLGRGRRGRGGPPPRGGQDRLGCTATVGVWVPGGLRSSREGPWAAVKSLGSGDVAETGQALWEARESSGFVGVMGGATSGF